MTGMRESDRETQGKSARQTERERDTDTGRNISMETRH